LGEIQRKALRVFVLAIQNHLYRSTSLSFYFFKLRQPLTVSTVQLLYTVKEKGEKPNNKTRQHPLSYNLRNPYRNIISDNSQNYAQKPQRTCTFLILVSDKISQKEGE
jgi:hypothetical protein